jgi:hypothetical protein
MQDAPDIVELGRVSAGRLVMFWDRQRVPSIVLADPTKCRAASAVIQQVSVS